MGTTLAVVQSVWIVHCFNEAWVNSVNVGVSSYASVLSVYVVWSCYFVLFECAYKFVNAMWCYYHVMHEWVWVNAFVWNGGCLSFWVNTDWKCWLSMLALIRLSDLMNPSLSCSGGIPDWSFLCCLM